MVEEPYSSREITALFKAAEERSEAFHERLMDRMDEFEKRTIDSLKRIEDQTTKTNGRVTAIEKEFSDGRIASLENYRSVLVGGLLIISSFVIPLLIYIYTHGLK